eukprot:CAMPEP_0197600484 /NCGR_PEP_ID=MMETSP1326-20131121/33368_1 /TAXON_ID=1155430 /ORGANISM="Genus nov. species nov., Strain RCC2288" /LENGTH=258 /DNA_ID=CAMNT_0043167591 /DNA_START=51 /DNA_END=824 /DNA_ORIENTATION=-
MAPKKAPPKKNSKVAGNTVKALLETISVDPATAFEGCGNLADEFKKVKAAYFAAVLKEHPDKGGDVETFRGIQSAFETLKEMMSNGQIDSFVVSAKSKTSTAASFKRASTANADKDMPSWEFYEAAATETMPTYRCETAKSNRSKCNSAHCVFSQDPKPFVIPKDGVRIGPIDKQSGQYSKWVHLDCWRVPGKISAGVPHPSRCQDPEQFEAALLSMNDVLLCGFCDLSAEDKRKVAAHVMVTDHWAGSNLKKIQPSD